MDFHAHAIFWEYTMNFRAVSLTNLTYDKFYCKNIASNWSWHFVLYSRLKGEMTVWSLYAQLSEDQDTVIKAQMPFV